MKKNTGLYEGGDTLGYYVTGVMSCFNGVFPDNSGQVDS